MITGIIVIILGTLLTSAGYWLGYRFAKEEHRIDLDVYDQINKKLSDALVAERRKHWDPDYPTWPKREVTHL